MGAVYSTSGTGRHTEWYSENIKIPIEEQCGIIACSSFTGVSVEEVIKVSQKIKLYDQLSTYKEKGILEKDGGEEPKVKSLKSKNCLYCKDIKKLMVALGHTIQDCRFCSYARDTKERLPFPEHINGIVALKLDPNGDLTHWVAFKHDEILDGQDEFATVSKLKRKYKTFDGYGFKLAIWDEENFDILQNTMSVACKSITHFNGAICEHCSRKSFCIEKKFFDAARKTGMDAPLKFGSIFKGSNPNNPRCQ